jgi:hypothetical protein
LRAKPLGKQFRQQDEEHDYRDGGYQRRERQTARDRLVDLLVNQNLPPCEALPTPILLALVRDGPFAGKPVDTRSGSMALPAT